MEALFTFSDCYEDIIKKKNEETFLVYALHKDMLKMLCGGLIVAL